MAESNGHIAEMIKQAVGKMAETEALLHEHLAASDRENRELRAANDVLTREKQELQRQLNTEQEVRRTLENVISQVAALVQ